MRRLLPIAVALGISLVAFGLALGVNTAIGWAIAVPSQAVPANPVQEPGPGANPEQPPSPPAKPPVSLATYIEVITGRNLFDHDAIGVSATGANTEATEPIAELRIRLLATMVAEPASYSSALIATDDKGAIAEGYGIGDLVQGATIIEIEPKQITVERNGKRQVVTLNEDGSKPTATTAVRRITAPDSEVTQVDDTNFEIEREVLDKYLSDLDGLARLGRARPHKDADGNVDGYRLSGIRRNSIASKLGIKNGDIVHNVNGNSLTSLKEAMNAWRTLQNQGSFSFEVTRRGKRQSMNYQVR